MGLFLSLAVSLALTLALELSFALLWGVRRRDLPLAALANCLTNPPVVLCHVLAAEYIPALLLPATFALELGAVLTEGYLYRARSGVKFPWLFSLCANLFSFTAGLLL